MGGVGGGWEWIGGGVCVGTSICGCAYTTSWSHGCPSEVVGSTHLGTILFKGSSMYVTMIRELMTMLFPGGAASGHYVHCGCV